MTGTRLRRELDAIETRMGRVPVAYDDMEARLSGCVGSGVFLRICSRERNISVSDRKLRI